MKKSFSNLFISTVMFSGVLFFAISAKNTVNAQSNGIGSAITAYYDHNLYTILFVEFSATSEKTLIAKNPGLNFIYQSDPGLPGGAPFVSVIDAIPTDGMNPVWQEIQIVFNKGFTPRQLFSDDEIFAAASGPNPEITLVPTTEAYRCPVIGFKPL